MNCHVVAYISRASWRGTKQLRAVLGDAFEAGPLPYVLGPYGHDAARSIQEQALAVGRWNSYDDVLLEGPPGALMTSHEAIRLVCAHEFWSEFVETFGGHSLDSWNVAVAVTERCFALTASRPEGGLGSVACAVVDREFRRVFPRFDGPLAEYVESHTVETFRLGDTR